MKGMKSSFVRKCKTILGVECNSISWKGDFSVKAGVGNEMCPYQVLLEVG